MKTSNSSKKRESSNVDGWFELEYEWQLEKAEKINEFAEVFGNLYVMGRE